MTYVRVKRTPMTTARISKHLRQRLSPWQLGTPSTRSRSRGKRAEGRDIWPKTGSWGCGKTSMFMRLSRAITRSEEHTSELQSRGHLVCRLLLEKKKTLMKEDQHHLDDR